MAKERRSRLPLLLLIIAIVVVVVWWRQEQAKRAVGDSFPEPGGYQPVTPAKPPTMKSTAAPAKSVAKKTGSSTAVKKAAAKKQPAKPRGAA